MNGTELAERSAVSRAKRRIGHKLGPWAVFFKGFIQHPVMVGSIIPSSRFTINRMLARTDWDLSLIHI